MTATAPLVYKGAADGGCPVTFDADAHEYRLKGKWLPGATRVLADNGYSKGSRFFTSESRRRGKAGHYATQLLDEHCPEATTIEEALETLEIDERLLPYMEGYLLFKKERQFVPIYHEVLVYSPTYHVCGHFDVYGRTPQGTLLADLKTWKTQGPTVKRGAALQAAGYKWMARECLGLEADLAEIVALPGNGKYREFPSTNPMDESLFLANCSVWWDKKNAGLMEDSGEGEVELAE